MSTTPQNAKLLQKLRRRALIWTTAWVMTLVGLVGLSMTSITLQAAPLSASSAIGVALVTILITMSIAGLVTFLAAKAIFRYFSALVFSKQ